MKIDCSSSSLLLTEQPSQKVSRINVLGVIRIKYFSSQICKQVHNTLGSGWHSRCWWVSYPLVIIQWNGVWIESESHLVLSDSLGPMDCVVHGILQARIPEWVAFPFTRGSSQPGIEPRSPALQMDSLPAEPRGNPENDGLYVVVKLRLFGCWTEK